MGNNRRKDCPESCLRYKENINSPCIKGAGSATAKVMLIGENPGYNEDKKGIPFVGRSGKLLNEIFADLEIDREEWYITNAVKCFTNQDETKPKVSEIKACKPYLIEEIKRVKPNVIGALGNSAIRSLLNREGINKIKNNIFMSEEFGIKVIPTFHPAYVLRNPGAYNYLYDGIKMILEESKKSSIVYKSPIKTKYLIADTKEKLNKVLDELEKKEKFAFDLETSDLNYLTNIGLSFGVSWKKGLGISIPWELLEGKELDRLQKILLSDKLKIGQNVKFDIQCLLGKKHKVKGPFFDTMLAHHLINENMKHGLNDQVLEYTDMGEYWAPLEASKAKVAKDRKIKKEEITYDMLPRDLLYLYGAKDCDATYRMYDYLLPELERQNLKGFYDEHVMPFMPIILEMEYRGIKIDRKKLLKLIPEYLDKVVKAEKELYADPDLITFEKAHVKEEAKKYTKAYEESAGKLIAKYKKSKNLQSRFPDGESTYVEYRIPGGKEKYIKDKIKKAASATWKKRYKDSSMWGYKFKKEEDYLDHMLSEKLWAFNFNSPKQLRSLLFDQMGLPVIKEGKEGPSTDKEVMEELDMQGVEIAQKIVAYRTLVKYIGTYLVSVYEKSEVDGRIHTSFLQAGTVSGRLSSKSPNLQNIPRSAKDFKSCFVSDPGYTFVKADLAQAEFRCWAHYSGDEDMIQDIESGLDIHKRTASEVFDVPEEEIPKDDERRSAAKNCVGGDTWIPTTKGMKHIKNIRIGDTVLDHFNKEQRVLETIKKEDDLYTVSTECGRLNCTQYHPFYIIDSKGKLITKPLMALLEGDYILSCTPENRKKGYISWRYKGARNTSFKPLFDKWVLTPDLAYLLGFIIAEGSGSEKSGHVNMRWYQKGEYVKRIDRLSKKIFGDRVKVSKDKNGVVRWIVSSLEFVEFIKYIGMCVDNEKGIKSFPEKIMESPEDVQKAFIQGYFLGDGTFKNHLAAVGTVSKDLSDGICLMLRNFGIYPKVMIEHPKGGKVFYNIHITTLGELDILINKLEIKPPKKWEPPKQNNGRKFLNNVNSFYIAEHPDCNVRYGVKLRKKITHNFLKKYCLGVHKEIDELVENGIYSVKIKSIDYVGKRSVYDFITTGDKTMVANGFYTLDCVFGVMYGRGPKAIAHQYKISIEKAQQLRESFFNRYPVAKDWLKSVILEAEAHGCVKTWFGRVRRLPNIDSDISDVKAEAERQAMNSPIQGQATDMNNAYMRETLKRAKEQKIKCFPCATVHDANFIQVVDDKIEDLRKIMKDVVATMFPDFKCRMELDFEVGKTLGTLEER